VSVSALVTSEGEEESIYQKSMTRSASSRLGVERCILEVFLEDAPYYTTYRTT